MVDSFLAARSKMPKLTPESHDHMLYFLHIPRTAGRTYHACFLKCESLPSLSNMLRVASLCFPLWCLSGCMPVYDGAHDAA